jgi:type I restriction enzyme S subunit
MTRTGNTGQVVTGVNGVFHNNFFKVNYDERLDKDFLVQFLRSEKTQKLIIRYAGTSTIPDLNHKDFYRLSIPLYDIQQQIKIGSLLSTMDKLIEEKEKLISNNKLLMNSYSDLLFNNNDFDFMVLPFNELFQKYKAVGNVSKNDYLDNGSYPIISQEKELINGYSENESLLLKENCYVFGDHTLVLKNITFPFIQGADGTVIIKPSKFDHEYSFYLLQRNLPNSEGYKRHFSILNKVDFKVHSDQELQRKIGNLLSSMDKIIDLHKQELEQLKLKKKYYLNKIFN